MSQTRFFDKIVDSLPIEQQDEARELLLQFPYDDIILSEVFYPVRSEMGYNKHLRKLEPHDKFAYLPTKTNSGWVWLRTVIAQKKIVWSYSAETIAQVREIYTYRKK